MENVQKRLRLDDLLAEKRSVWVVNKSKPKGRLSITFVEPGTLRSIIFEVPNTWIPICATDIVPPDLLKSSHDFRKFLMKGYIELVDPDKAEEIMQTDDAQSEHTRIYQGQYVDEKNAQMSDPNKPNQNETGASTGDNPNPRILDVVSRLNKETTSVEDVLGELRSLADDLTSTDLSYLITQAKAPGVITWAKTRLAS